VPEHGEPTVVECNGRVVRVPVELEDRRGSVTLHPEQPEGRTREPWPVRMTGGKVWGGCSLEAGEGMKVIPHGDHVTLWAAEWPATVDVVGCDEEAERVNVQFEAIERDTSDRWSRAAYADEVRFVDGEVGRLLEALEAGGWLEDALVVFASDHGEGLGEHNLGGHINQLYDSLLHVPLILWAPGHLPAGVVVGRPVSLVDVLPTVVALTGHDPLPGQRGASLVPLIGGSGGASKQRWSATHGGWTAKPQAPHNLESWLSGRFKLIRNVDTGQRELYDVRADPGELNDLAEKEPSVLRRLQAELEGLQMEEHTGSWERLDEKDLDRLRALGYVN
jgi:arylsulfatase A-like enzyme